MNVIAQWVSASLKILAFLYFLWAAGFIFVSPLIYFLIPGRWPWEMWVGSLSIGIMAFLGSSMVRFFYLKGASFNLGRLAIAACIFSLGGYVFFLLGVRAIGADPWRLEYLYASIFSGFLASAGVLSILNEAEDLERRHRFSWPVFRLPIFFFGGYFCVMVMSYFGILASLT